MNIPVRLLILAVLCVTRMPAPSARAQSAPVAPAGSEIEFWHGDRHRVGHLGDAQDDFNVLGHVARWPDLDALSWALRGIRPMPLSFRAYRRLVEEGDFNVDVPIGMLRTGENTITLIARYRDGSTATRDVVVVKSTGRRPLPFRIDWSAVTDPQNVGQYVDGRWALTPVRQPHAAAQ